LAPTHWPPKSICLAGEEEANAQRDDHEKIARKAVSVKKGSRDGTNPICPIQIEDVAATAEEFEHSIERFKNAHEEDGNNEVMGYPIPVIRKPPVKEKEKEAGEGQPLEEMDLGGKRKETEGSYW